MGVKDYDVIFDQLDNSCCGFINAGQLQEFHKSVYFSSIPVSQINMAINQICGASSIGKVTRELFLVVLAEIERRRTIQEQAYWDFRALDCNGDSRIDLKDALMLFQEFHGENFSLEMWNKFLSSREYQYCDVYYDEIKSWLCDQPEGPPCNPAEFEAEEKRLDEQTKEMKWKEYESWKHFQVENECEEDEYRENVRREVNRKLLKWNRQGVEAMLYDDGLDLAMDSDNQQFKPKHNVNMADLLQAVEQKYNILQDRLLLKMAEFSSNMEDEVTEIFQALRKKIKQLLKDKNLVNNVTDLHGAHALMPYTLLALLGYHKSDEKFKLIEQEIYKFLNEGKTEQVKQLCEEEFEKLNDGIKNCGDVLVQLQERHHKERDYCLSLLHKVGDGKSTMTSLHTELISLSHQHSLLGYESGIIQSVLSVGLGERSNDEYLSGLDDIRSQKLVLMRLDEKKGRKQARVTDGKVTLDRTDDLGVVDLKLKVISEIDRKHFFEREAMMYMLQGPESKETVEDMRKLSATEQQQELNNIRNKHENWTNNITPVLPDTQCSDIHQNLLQKAVSLYWLQTHVSMEKKQPNVTDDEISTIIFSKLNLFQESEIKQKIEEIQSMTTKDLRKLIKKEHTLCINECFNGIAFIAMGSIQLSDEDKEFIEALDEKYSTLRDKIFIFILQQKHGLDWINLADEIKEKEISKLRKQEKKMRFTGKFEDFVEFLGPKIMELPSLSQALGPHKWKTNDTVSINQDILSNLINRYNSEQQALINWLQTDEVKTLTGRKKRKEIVYTRLQTRTMKLVQDFQASFLITGLLERLEDISEEDKTRVTRLSEVNVKSWRERTKHGMIYRKVFQDQQKLTKGDITSLQLQYLTEVKYRHSDEREELLQIVKEVSSEYLQEAAAMMGQGDRQKTLSELQTKYQQLDLTSKDDHEEYRTILEEAAAIQVICRKALLQKERRRGVTPDMTAVSLLENLYKQQHKEIYSIYSHLDKMDEKELVTLQSKVLEMRKNNISPNVIKVLTMVQGAAHDHDILQAIDRKYDVLKDRLLLESIKQSVDEKAWNKLTDNDKQNKVDKLKETTEIPWRQGKLDEFASSLDDDFKLTFDLQNILGADREQFVKTGEIEILKTEKTEVSGCDVVQYLWNRHEAEKDYFMSLSQGTSGIFMSDGEKFVVIARLKREITLCNSKSSLCLSGLVAGILERQVGEVMNLCSSDFPRYEILADDTIEWCKTEKIDIKIDCPITSSDIMLLQNNVLTLLQNQNLQEQLDWYQILTNQKQAELRSTVSVKSQQQRADRLVALKNNLSALNSGDSDEYIAILLEAMVYKTENLLSNSEHQNKTVDQMNNIMMASLLQYQQVQAEKILQNFSKQTTEELTWLSNQITSDQHNKKCNNIVEIVFSIDFMRESSKDEILAALEGKYDALRDKLLVEALILQYGELDWSKITDEERQRKVMELKLKERKLRREGKVDEINKLIGASLKNQEALAKLMGDNQAEQERKLKDKLEKRKKRLKEGKTEEECNILEKEDKEKEEDAEGTINVLQELQNRFDQEKEQLANQLLNSEDIEEREKQKQLQLIKLHQEERKARNEDRFESAALVVGLAQMDSEKVLQNEEAEKERQWRLAKERLMAARRKRVTGSKPPEEIIEENIDNITNKTRLREILLMLNDKHHRINREFLIKLLEDVDKDVVASLQPKSYDYLENKITESYELRLKWKESLNYVAEDEIIIFKEMCGCTIEVKGREKKNEYDLDEVKVELLADLQHLQDIEIRKLRLQIPLKDNPWLKEKIKELKEGESHDNVAMILFLGKGQPVEQSNKDESAVIAALEQKYDVIRDKLIVEALMKEMGQADWSRLTQLEKQKQVIQIKLKSRKMKKEGKMDSEISDIIINHLQDAKAVDTLFGASKIEQQRRLEDKLAQRRHKKLDREATMGVTRENSSLQELRRYEEKTELKKNILENLEKQLEADKERLLSSLRSKTNKFDRAKARWKFLAKLQREKSLLQAEDNIESAVLVFSIGNQNAFRKEKTFIRERQRQRELAKGRLQITKKCLEENQQDILKDLEEERKLSVKHMHVKERMMENMNQHHQYEREVFMKLLKLAGDNIDVINKAKEQTEEELNVNLKKLQKDQIKLLTNSQQVALTVNLDKMNQSEQQTYFVGVAKRRAEQFKYFKEAVIYRIEVELRMMKENRVDSTEEDLYKELSVSLLADLQERQETESSTLQNIIPEKDDEILENINGVQKVAHREGWYKNLSVVIFTLTSSSDDLDLLPDIIMETRKLEEEFEQEKQEITDKAVSSSEDPGPMIEELTEQYKNKKQVMLKKYEDRCLEIRAKLAARKHASEKKDLKEIETTQLVEMAQTYAKGLKTGGQPIRRKTSLLQERLSLHREEKVKAEEKEKEKQKTSSRSKSVDSKRSALSKQEKTVLDIEISDDQKQVMFSQLVRQQNSVQTKIADQQKQQEAMLQRRLEVRRHGNSQDKTDQAVALLNLGERQKTVLAKAQNAEKERQSQLVEEKGGKNKKKGV